MDEQALYQLLSWLAPENFFAGQPCSQALEFAVEAGLVRDAASLTGWLIALLSTGAAHVDAVIFRAAYEVAAAQNADGFAEIAQIAASLLSTMGVVLVSASLGASFLEMVRRSYPDPALDDLVRFWEGPIVHPVAVAAACGTRPASCRIPVTGALTAYLRAYVAQLISSSETLLPISQSDAQMVATRLEQPTLDAVRKALATDLNAFGGGPEVRDDRGFGYMAELSDAHA